MDQETVEGSDNPVKGETNSFNIVVNIQGIWRWIWKWVGIGKFVYVEFLFIISSALTLWFWFFEWLRELISNATIIALLIILALVYCIWKLTKKLEQKEQECKIHQNTIAQWEQRLFEKTQKISKRWIEQWNEGVRQWERSILEIKNLEADIKVSGNRPSLVMGMCAQGQGELCSSYERELNYICAQGQRELCSLYIEALKEELTDAHYEKIDVFLKNENFKEYYEKAVQLMKENGILIEEVVYPYTQEKYQPMMLLLHWYLYVLDDMITAKCKQQEKNNANNIVSLEIFEEGIYPYTEDQEIMIMLLPMKSREESKQLLTCKEELLSLLCGISNKYKVARETFFHYKKLIEAVKDGYTAFDEGCDNSTVGSQINICRNRDQKKEKENSFIAEGTLTFEEAYKLGARERMRSSNKICDTRWIFWEKLLKGELSSRKLNIIFGEEGVQALKKAVEEKQTWFNLGIQTAIRENKAFHYDEAGICLIDTLRDS